MFFAARTFIQKLGTTLGVAVMASLTSYGETGIRMSAGEENSRRYTSFRGPLQLLSKSAMDKFTLARYLSEFRLGVSSY